MAKQVHKPKPKEQTEETKPTQTKREDSNRSRKLAQDTEYAEAVKHELDEVIDAIDELLEENAEAFVKGFVQKGGQ